MKGPRLCYDLGCLLVPANVLLEKNWSIDGRETLCGKVLQFQSLFGSHLAVASLTWNEVGTMAFLALLWMSFSILCSTVQTNWDRYNSNFRALYIHRNSHWLLFSACSLYLEKGNTSMQSLFLLRSYDTRHFILRKNYNYAQIK